MPSLSEFALIEKFFNRHIKKRNDVILGIGDDCAIVKVPVGFELAVAVDTLVAGVHFFNDAPPKSIGYKSLAVNLSDFAALGAEPAWVTLSLTIPSLCEQWLQEFCQGFFQLVDQYSLQLIGGDTTHGPLNITVQVLGFSAPGKALRRDGAKPGDNVYVTGTIGGAGLALQCLQGARSLSEPELSQVLSHLYFPKPRVKEGQLLQGLATSAIDISDGLAQDVGHILQASEVGATIYVDKLPIAASLRNHLNLDEQRHVALTAGDDYELCFTAPAHYHEKITSLLSDVSVIGNIDAKLGLRLVDQAGTLLQLDKHGYQHF